MKSASAPCLLWGMILVGLTTGCAAKPVMPYGANSKAPRHNSRPVVEIETAQEQALKEVMSSPTSFVVSYPEAPYSWERAKLFFELYTTRYDESYSLRPQDGAGLREEVLLSNSLAREDNYYYQVKKTSERSGLAYVVSCRPRREPGDLLYAERNARNLARFIRQGQLEVSLLKR